MAMLVYRRVYLTTTKGTVDGWNSELEVLNAGFLPTLRYEKIWWNQKKRVKSGKSLAPKNETCLNTAIPSKLRHSPVYADINLEKQTKRVHPLYQRSYFMLFQVWLRVSAKKNAKTFLHNSEHGIPRFPMGSNRNIILKHCNSGWWFQPIWKILVKLEIFLK